VHKWLPTAEQVTIDGCGHVPQVEHPEETNALLLSFFSRTHGTCATGHEGYQAAAEAA
jgi:hypothetical protein